MKKKSASSARWLARQREDIYTQMARKQHWRSRSVFKLEEIDKKDDLIKPGMKVLDLGAAPGGWCQYLAKKLYGKSNKTELVQIIGLDILHMDPIPGVTFLQGDFREDSVVQNLIQMCPELDLVICDIAPNFSGIEAVDSARMGRLNDLALEVVMRSLKVGGHFLIKVFQGPGHQQYLTQLKSCFSSVVCRKPKASRPESRELYCLAKNRKHDKNIVKNISISLN